MDRISGLPKTILHDILSRLPEKDVVRISVLSNTWRETWLTFPVLSICDAQIFGAPYLDDFKRRRMTFLDYVRKTILRFYDQGLAIKEFKLNVHYFNLQYMSEDLDLWMKLVSESGVGVLELRLPFSFEGMEGGQAKCYTLRQGVLEAKTLNNVVLMGGIKVDQAFLNHSIKFFSLRVLTLNGVFLRDEVAIEHLISHCPLIESITLNWCFVYNPLSIGRPTLLESLSMHGLQRVNKVDIAGIQEVYIDAPNLENLSYHPSNSDMPYKMKFDSCRNLRCLCLASLSNVIADQWFVELFSKFPLLESLNLKHCSMSERITISSTRLKILKLSSCFKNLKEVKIDAPNLLSCSYSCRRIADTPVISFLRSSSQLKVIVKMVMEFLDLYNMRELIENFKPSKVVATLSVFIHQLPHVDEPNVDVLLVSSPPPSIKHLKLLGVVQSDEALYLPIVNRLLSSCWPETISFDLVCSRSFIEFFYKTLTGRNQDDCYCSSGHTKCWWHGSKDVKVTCSVKNDENVDFKTMLDELSTSAQVENTSFRLDFVML